MSLSEVQLTSLVSRAGAGAGKTTELVSRVVASVSTLKASLGREPRIVVTTFTRKATQELRERLVTRACELRNEELLHFVSGSSGLHISTIHGVLTLFLRRYGHLVGMDPNFSILGEAEEIALERKVLRDLLSESAAAKGLLEVYPFSELNLILRQIVSLGLEHPAARPAGPEDFLAAASKIWGNIATDLDETIVALTEELKPGPKHDPFRAWILAAQEILPHLKSVKPEPDWWRKLDALVQRLPVVANRGKEKPLSDATNARLLASKKKLNGTLSDRPGLQPALWPKFYQGQQSCAELAREFGARIWQLKKQMAQMSIADLELRSLEVLREQPGLGQAFASDWDYWLIDEYQDTSPLQVELFRALRGDRPRFVVGDPQQSIYLFRGARSEVFAAAEAEILAEGGQAHPLEVNYRSRPELLSFINDFFTGMGGGFRAMLPDTKKAAAPGARVAVFHGVPAESEQGELAAISSRLSELVVDEGVSPSEILILARTNRHLHEIARHLKALGWPTHLHVATGFHERREILDAMALFKFLLNPADDLNLVSLLRSPWFRLSDSWLAALASRRTRHKSLFSVLLTEDNTVIQHLLNLRSSLSEIGVVDTWMKGLIEFGVFDFCHHHDPTGRREANLWKLVHEVRRAEREPGFQPLRFLSEALRQPTSDLGSNEGDATAALEPDCINLMTVHAAKGLDAEHVLITGCASRPQLSNTGENVLFDEERKCWSLRINAKQFDGLVDDDEIDSEWVSSPIALSAVEKLRQAERAEMARLLYVAVTRAKQSVTFTWTGAAETGSWRELWQWNDSVGGTVSRSNYLYEVRTGEVEPQRYPGATSAVSAVRPPWQALVDGVSESVSVSDLVMQSSSTRGALAKQSILARAERTSRGVRLHRLFELARYHPLLKVLEEMAPALGAEAGPLREICQRLLSQTQVPLAHLLQSGEAEFGFQVQCEDLVLEGQIDLWGQDPSQDQIWIIDYKSGRSENVALAEAQLNIYAWALRALKLAKKTCLAVIYPTTGEIKIVKNYSSAEFEERFPRLKVACDVQ